MATWYGRAMKVLSTIVVAALSFGALHALQTDQRSVTVGDGITVSVREAGTGPPGDRAARRAGVPRLLAPGSRTADRIVSADFVRSAW
jgi:hypothetical protein